MVLKLNNTQVQRRKFNIDYLIPVDNFGTVVGENPDCLLLSGTVVGENPDHVCWDIEYYGQPSKYVNETVHFL